MSFFFRKRVEAIQQKELLTSSSTTYGGIEQGQH